MDRRQFLGTAIAAAATAAARADDEDERIFPIIDTHQHLWDLDRFRLPWLKKVPALAKDYLPADYQAATADLGDFAAGLPGKIVQTVYMEVDVDPEQQTAEGDHILALCRRADNPMTAAVLSGRPDAEGFAAYLDRFKDVNSLKGIRRVLHVDEAPPRTCLKKEFVAGVRLLGERGLRFDLCMRSKDLPDAAKLIDLCPDTRFILDHCGNADVQAKDRSQWQKDIAEVARRKHVVCKVSGIIASAKKGAWTVEDLAPIVKHTMEVFGPDRVMFGGDWPVCTLTASYAQWVGALREIVAHRSSADQRKLFHDNAMRFYELS
jgi:predicted TIM-barrel fold metal-dependent hydrolase